MTNEATGDMFCTVFFCVDPDCRCEHRSGVVVYSGPSREDAEAALSACPDRDDYASRVEEYPLPPPGGHRRPRAMRLQNSTTWTAPFLRRMLSWVCRELGCRPAIVRSVTVRNRSRVPWSGHAWRSGRIVLSIGPDSAFPSPSYTFGDGFSVGPITDRIEGLVAAAAHEVAHLDNGDRGNKSRRGGSWGGSERYTEARAKRVLEAFRADRDALLAGWSKAPTRPERKPQSAVERRAAHATAMLATWERKMKLARTKLAAWKRKVRYYEKRGAAAALAAPAAPSTERNVT